MDSLVNLVQEKLINKNEFPSFSAGDTLTVTIEIREGDKVRPQSFKGVVIQVKGRGQSKTFTIRKMSGTVGVERIFPYYSPIIDSIKVLKRGKVRRAKLFYVRKLIGKAARLKERILTKEQKLKQSAKAKKAEKKEDA